MRKKKRILWRLFASYIFIIVISLALISIYAISTHKRVYLNNLAQNLHTRATMLSEHLNGMYGAEYGKSVDEICRDLGARTQTRYTVILTSGLVIGDSDEDPAVMGNHADRPEISRAISGRAGEATRYSATLKKQMMYLALPVEKDGEIVAVVRSALPITFIDGTLGRFYFRVALAGLAVAILSAFLSLMIARWINNPLRAMQKGALKFIEGDLSYRLEVPDTAEAADLAQTMNDMASQLGERIRTVTEQRNELEAVLGSMVEAVLVLDANHCVTHFNEAAKKLFGPELADGKGRGIQEISRNVDLLQFVEKLFESETAQETDITLISGQEKYLQAHGTFIHDADGAVTGVLVVLNDVTRLKKLENIRRDFVANVSHELKTPITSIKGFVETLRDGAINEPENAVNFLNIIATHSDRLNAIIDDLLSLSRIEQSEQRKFPEMQVESVADLVKSSVLVCKSKSAKKDIPIEMDCDEDLKVTMNKALLEQALINLIDNAVKYSNPGEPVRVTARRIGDEAVIDVTDHGCGIPGNHLPRIFERFYRVDKARSRELGGTGLGLSIVKHIVNAHLGSIEVKSKVGEGSAFSIHLPVD